MDLCSFLKSVAVADCFVDLYDEYQKIYEIEECVLADFLSSII
jgi:hypothetical protein